MKKISLGLLLLMVLPGAAIAAGQHPTQPGWPQPMNNNRWFGYGSLDQNELRIGSGETTYRWEGEGWYGGNLNRAWFKTEGNLNLGSGALEEAEVQALYSRAITRYFNLQTGVRYDISPMPSRVYGTLGVEGLAPLNFKVGAYLFFSDGGQYSVRLEGQYDLYLTQRLVLQPQVEINFYTTNEKARGIGGGLSDLESGLRLRYEIRREIAPYIGVVYQQKFGKTADFAREEGESLGGFQFLLGLNVWF